MPPDSNSHDGWSRTEAGRSVWATLDRHETLIDAMMTAHNQCRDSLAKTHLEIEQRLTRLDAKQSMTLVILSVIGIALVTAVVTEVARMLHA